MTDATAADAAPLRQRAVAVVVADEQVLVIRRVKDGRRYAVLPGGGIEPGETASAACLRELAEETGLAGTIIAPLLTDEGLELAWYFQVAAQGEPELGGPEASRAHPGNSYAPTWLPVRELESVDLVPEEAHRAVRAVFRAQNPPG